MAGSGVGAAHNGTQVGGKARRVMGSGGTQKGRGRQNGFREEFTKGHVGRIMKTEQWENRANGYRGAIWGKLIEE